MASRRRRPPPRPEGADSTIEPAPLEEAERTVIGEMPVFDDEAETPVPEVSAPPPRPAPSRAPRAPSPKRPEASPSRPASARPATRKPRPESPRGPATPPSPARVASSPKSAARPRKASKPTKPRAGALGASPVPAAPDPSPPTPREATFVGLPVGLGAPPAKPTPPPESTPTPPEGLKRPARARSSRPGEVSVSAADPAAPRGEVSVRPAPSGSPLRLPTPGGSDGLRLPSPGEAPSASTDAGPTARAATPVPSGAAPSPEGGRLTLPTPGGSSSGLTLPPAAGVPAAAPELSGAAPSKPDRLPLGFDAPAAPDADRVDLPVLDGPSEGAGPGRWLMVLAAVAIAGVVGAFVLGDDGPRSAATENLAAKRTATTERGEKTYARAAPVAEAPRRVSSAVARGGGQKGRAASIARRQSRHPSWPAARVAELAAPGAEVPVYGGERREPENFRRKYLEDETSRDVPMIVIFTHPPGMTVELAGKVYGRTPMLRPLMGEASSLDIKLSGAGFATKELTLRPDKDGSFRFNGVMSPVAAAPR